MKILIIEDEKKVSEFLRKGFAAESYSVDIAADVDLPKPPGIPALSAGDRETGEFSSPVSAFTAVPRVDPARIILYLTAALPPPLVT